jgi:hypothetical protein
MSLVKETLQDWLTLAASATTNPVPIHTVAPRAPTCLAAMDASGNSKGGFWVTPTNNTLWRLPLTPTIRRHLITPTTPQGTVTNSDLELAAIVLGSALVA